MPLFGAHLSVAGGLHKAAEAARGLGMDTVQVFTSNPNAWAPKKPDSAAVAAFRKAVAEHAIQYPTSHDSYLINLAAPDNALWNKSIDAFVAGLQKLSNQKITVMDYHEHAIGAGADAKAITYIELRVDGGKPLFGVGMDSNIVTASLKAILCGVNRHVRMNTPRSVAA